MSIMLSGKIEAVLDRVGVKERAKIDKHLAACDAGGDGGSAASCGAGVGVAMLGELAPLSMQSVGNQYLEILYRRREIPHAGFRTGRPI